MPELYLPNHDVHARVLVTDPSLARLEERDRASLAADAVRLRAFYVNADDEPVGVVATAEGPVLLAGERRLPLAHGRSKATVHPLAGRQRLFQLAHDGAPWLTLEYEEPLSPGGPWGDEETLDFFLWLSRELEDPAFFAYWTHPIPS